MRDQALDEITVRVENTDETVARPGHVVVFVGVLFGIGHVNGTVDVLDSKRCIARGNCWIDEGLRGIYLGEILIINLHFASVEIRHVETVSASGRAESSALVNGAISPVVNRENGLIG